MDIGKRKDEYFQDFGEDLPDAYEALIDDLDKEKDELIKQLEEEKKKNEKLQLELNESKAILIKYDQIEQLLFIEDDQEPYGQNFEDIFANAHDYINDILDIIK